MAPRCQCDPQCPAKPLKGSPFCSKHKTVCSQRSPLSGFEPTVGLEKYNKTVPMLDTHNCFAYAFDYVDMPDKKLCNNKGCNIPFHQPGRRSGYPKWSKVKGKRCPDLLGRLKGDIPSLTTTNFTRKCKRGTYKVALVVDPTNDYHFYRQDADGMWSHKPGGTKVTRVDASRRPIYNPELADRDYTSDSGLNYKQFCSYVCAPKQTRKLKRGGKRSTKCCAPSRRVTKRRKTSQ